LLILTAINFVHVNGKSLYIVDWRMMVVEGGKYPTPCNNGEGMCPDMSRGICLGEKCPWECLDPNWTEISISET